MTQKKLKCGDICILKFKNPNLAQNLREKKLRDRTVAPCRNSDHRWWEGGGWRRRKGVVVRMVMTKIRMMGVSHILMTSSWNDRVDKKAS